MKTLINIVHPDTYKATKENGRWGINIGEEKSVNKRNQRVLDFVYCSLENGSEVFVHRLFSSDFMKMGYRDLAVESDKKLSRLIKDEKIKKFRTLDGGVPLQDEKPDYVPQETWDYTKSQVITDSELKDIVGKPEQTFFIGGLLEFCLMNFACHYTDNIAGGEKMYVVPELCVSIDERKVEWAMEVMKSKEIKSVSYSEAMRLATQ